MHHKQQNIDRHRSVMLTETIEMLGVSPQGCYLDATFGEGGHSEAMLQAGAKRVIGVDRDRSAIEAYQARGPIDSRLEFIHSRFSKLDNHFTENFFDGILADLGPSTKQLVDAQRGFSFKNDGPVDMRMDRDSDETLLAKLSSLGEKEIAERLVPFVKKGRKLAARLKRACNEETIESTFDVAKLAGKRTGPKHPATQLFLALRILVNEEQQEVETGLPLLVKLLKPGGRLVVLSFHSSEDRWVKRLFYKMAGRCVCEMQPCLCPREKLIGLLHKKPLISGRDEVRANPRSRSAKLRGVEKIAQSV